jgi:hypothetical protein
MNNCAEKQSTAEENAGELNGGTRTIRLGRTTKNGGYILSLVDLDEEGKKGGGRSEIWRREKAEHVFLERECTFFLLFVLYKIQKKRLL